MNDRYLFRAKRKDWKELPKVEQWIVGYYCPKSSYVNMNGIQTLTTEHTIVYELSENRYSQEEVDLSTLCQCTGLKDKAGTLIWENDIVYARCNGLSGKGVVKFENGCFVLKDRKRNRNYSLFGEWKFRIDGNIFDNLELLEEKERN